MTDWLKKLQDYRTELLEGGRVQKNLVDEYDKYVDRILELPTESDEVQCYLKHMDEYESVHKEIYVLLSQRAFAMLGVLERAMQSDFHPFYHETSDAGPETGGDRSEGEGHVGT